MTTRVTVGVLAALSSIATLNTANAEVVTYGFYAISENDPAGADAGEDQLSVTVSPAENKVSFLFTNTGPAPMSITEIYFESGPIVALAQILNSPGVSFISGASPVNLPGGNLATPPFVANIAFSAESRPPAQHNGVNPGESLQLIYTLTSDFTSDDVISVLASGAMRIGLHVQGFAGGTSESYINTNVPTNVPTPGAMALLAAGCLMFARRRRP
jgi:MprA protease rhombosortase-interaction domain-containing protein